MSKENTETTRIALVTPAGPTRRTGNRISGGRWARILRASGHRVTALDQYERQPCDLLIALHARRSHASIRQFRELHPDKPLIVVLTGTDLYRDIHVDEDSRESLRLATRLVVLQRKGLDELAPELHAKTRVIYQSASPYPGRPGDRDRQFTVAAVGHMRPEKDPFRTAMARAVLAARRPGSACCAHSARPLSEGMARRAERERVTESRVTKLAGRDYRTGRPRQQMARSHLLSITSHMEGSCNVLCEALASGVPVVASRISGLIGTLGDDYPGYSERASWRSATAGRLRGLKRLLVRAENDLPFYESRKRRWCTAPRCATTATAPLVASTTRFPVLRPRSEGLSRPRTRKGLGLAVGRIQERCRGRAALHRGRRRRPPQRQGSGRHLVREALLHKTLEPEGGVVDGYTRDIVTIGW